MSELLIEQHPLPYADHLESRDLSALDLVVIHCTELPDLAMARTYGERVHYPSSATGNSGHYYIDRNGSVEQWVPPERVAHHVRGFNEHSIGIELVNIGRYPHWLNSAKQAMTEHYSSEQLESLVKLLHFLCSAHPSLSWICGHDQLDTEKVPASDRPDLQVDRKCDPGPLFPWGELLDQINLRPYR